MSNVTNVLAFQVERKVVRAMYNSGLYIDIIEIKYNPEPKDLGNKMRYRIFYSLQENGIGICSKEYFSSDYEAIKYSFSDAAVSMAKQELSRLTIK
jgi:hypothetical protein